MKRVNKRTGLSKGTILTGGKILSLIFSLLILANTLPAAPREVKVSALYMDSTHYGSSPLSTKLAEAAPLIEESGKQDVDLVVLAETYFRGKSMAVDYQDFDKKTTVLDSMKVWGKKYNVNIVFQVYELEPNPTRIYNTAIVVDRNGDYVGKYRKVNPAPGSEAKLLTAGDSYPVFEMDFGKIGILICWDGWFTDPAKALVDNGAEILIIPTSENNSLNLQTITADNGVPVCYSVDHINDVPSSVYNHLGDSVFYNIQVGPNQMAVGTVPLGYYQNFALNMPVQASAGTDPQNPASNTVDGVYSIERDAPADSQTSWKASSLPQWIEIDLGDDYDIDQVSIAQFNTDGYQYQIEGKASEGNYEMLSDSVTKFESHLEWGIAGSEILSSRFEKKKVRYVKLTMNSASETDLTIHEIKVFGYDESLPTAVSENNKIPGMFGLCQNYPNPFNPTTHIQFDIAKNSHVRLDVFNVKGQKVSTLLDGFYHAGVHGVDWNGEDQNGDGVVSGVYFYRLNANENVLTRKMLLIE